MKALLLIVAVAAADQFVKQLVRRAPQGTLFEIPGVVRIVCRSNTGAAFSLFSGHTVLIAVLSASLLALLLWLLFKRMRLSSPARLALAFLVGGGAGNLIDRVLFGHVTDYIQTLFVKFPVFNLADICITASVAVLTVLLAVDRLEEKG